MQGERTNSDRARRAFAAVEEYIGRERVSLDDVDDAHQVVKDLLGDLRHLADRLGVDFDAADLAAGRIYTDERASDPAGDWPLYLTETV